MDSVSSEDIAIAINVAIKVIGNIVDKLNDLESEMKDFDSKKTAAKTVGTTINVVGTGLAITGAFFTGGVSLLAAGVISTIAGASTNLISDFIDRKETKECYEKIESFLDDYIREADKIKQLCDRFQAQIETMMSTLKLDYHTAFYLAMGGGGSPDFAVGVVAFSGASFIAKALSTVSLTTSEIKLLSNLFGITFTVSKTGASAGAAVSAGISTVAKTISKSAVVVGAVMVGFEVISLVKDFVNDHPTVSKIQDITSKLHSEQTKLKKTSEHLKNIAEAAVQQLKDAILKAQRKRTSKEEEEDDDEYVITVEFTIRKEDIKEGSPITPAVHLFIKTIGAPGDHAGHLRAKMFNGSGSDFTNFVPMSATLNMGEFKSHEMFVRSEVRDNNGAYANVKIHLHYRLKNLYPLRPFKIRHEFKIVYLNFPPFETSGYFYQ